MGSSLLKLSSMKCLLLGHNYGMFVINYTVNRRIIAKECLKCGSRKFDLVHGISKFSNP